jgi:excisionase family DNA binding protein
MQLLTTTEVQRRTGWSLPKIRALIESGKLPAINTSTGKRPFWQILDDALDACLRGETPQQAKPTKPVAGRKRIDANVPKIF